MDLATLTPPDERVRIARTKLSSRLADLEGRVTGTIDDAAGAVRETSNSIRSTVERVTGDVRATVETASHRVKEAFDLPKQVRAHPWESTLAVISTGFLAGLVSRRLGPQTIHPIRELFDAVRKELVTVGQTAIAEASKALKENVAALATKPAPQRHGVLAE